MSVRLVYRDVPPGVEKTAAIEAATVADARSDLGALISGPANRADFVTLGLNDWPLDGSAAFYEDGEVAYLSAKASDENGDFAEPPVIAASLAEPVMTFGVTLEFGGEVWAKSAEIVWTRGGAELDRITFEPDSASYFCENEVESFDGLTVTLYGTALPARRLRLDTLILGVVRTFLRDELRSVRVEQEIDPSARSLPVNTLDWTLSSRQKDSLPWRDASLTASGARSGSNLALLPYGTGRGSVIALDANSWLLDGLQSVWEDGAVAFLSAAASGADGAFAQAPSITVSYGDRYTTAGLRLIFGGDTWASAVTVAWYRGETPIDSAEFAPDAFDYWASRRVAYFDRITVTLHGTAIPGRRLLLRGVVVEARNRALAYLFRRKQPVCAYDGAKLLGVFYIEDSDRRGERVYDLTCVDAIGLLDDDPFPDAYYENKNALELAREICDGYEVEMDAALRNETVTGVLSGKTRRGALQQLCFALRAVADTTGASAIRVFRVAAPAEAIDVAPGRTRANGRVKESDVVTAVTVTAHAYSSEETEGADKVDIGGATYYDTKTVVTALNPDATANDRPKVESVADGTLVSPANARAVAEHLLAVYRRRKTHCVKFRLDGETPGDYLQTTTPWGERLDGHFVKASIALGGIAVSDSEVLSI